MKITEETVERTKEVLRSWEEAHGRYEALCRFVAKSYNADYTTSVISEMFDVLMTYELRNSELLEEIQDGMCRLKLTPKKKSDYGK